MQKEEEKEEDLILPAEEEDQPPWKAGIDEARQIMEACIQAARELSQEYFKLGVIERKHTRGHSGESLDVGDIAIAMYQSVVMMEMERGRLDALKTQMLGGGLEVPTVQFLRS